MMRIPPFKLSPLASFKMRDLLREVRPGPAVDEVTITDGEGVRAIHVSTGACRNLVEERGLSQASWDASGSALCIQMNDPPDRDVFLARPDQEVSSRILDSNATKYDSSRRHEERCPCFPVLSPDARFVSFCRPVDGDYHRNPPYSTLHIVEVESGVVREVAKEWIMESAWSPDGRQIAGLQYLASDRQRLRVMDLAGKPVREFDLPYNLHDLCWGPQADWILAHGYEVECGQWLEGENWDSRGPQIIVLVSLETGRCYPVDPSERSVRLCCSTRRPWRVAFVRHTPEELQDTLIIASIQGAH